MPPESYLMTNADIIKQAKQLHKTQIGWRRHLHQHPELSFKEFDTTAFLKKHLKQFGIKTKPIKMPTGLLAEINGNKKGRTVALRTDIDALPIVEKSGVPYSSKINGCMHACGHDVHMSVVLGAAKLLQENRDKLNGNVRLLFQPAEEMPPGGARPMIDNNALKDVSMIFGLHVDPNLPVGKISLRDGDTMASVLDVDIIIHGKGGHAARPQDTVDAIVVAADLITSLQTVISRQLDPIESAALTFGKIEGGTARNVITDTVKLTATARSLSPRAAKKLPQLIKRFATQICRAHGAKAEVNILAAYPVLSNHPEANVILYKAYTSLYGGNKIELTPQVLGGEDFACYLEKTKGAMFRLGIRNRKIAADKSWHSPFFKVDEAAIPYGTALLLAAVRDSLSQ